MNKNIRYVAFVFVLLLGVNVNATNRNPVSVGGMKKYVKSYVDSQTNMIAARLSPTEVPGQTTSAGKITFLDSYTLGNHVPSYDPFNGVFTVNETATYAISLSLNGAACGIGVGKRMPIGVRTIVNGTTVALVVVLAETPPTFSDANVQISSYVQVWVSKGETISFEYEVQDATVSEGSYFIDRAKSTCANFRAPTVSGASALIQQIG